jgi:hypothetical protein
VNIFNAYRFTEKTCRDQHRRILLTGLVPSFFALMLILSIPGGAGPGPWCAFGFCAGLLLVQWGVYGLHKCEYPRTPWGRRLMHHSDRWFPVFLFSTRKVYMLVLALMLWTCMTDIGYPSSFTLHFLFAMLLILYLVKSVTHEAILTPTDSRLDDADVIAHYSLIITIVLFLSVSMTHLTLPLHKPVTNSIPMWVVFIWIPAVLAILACLALCIHRCMKLNEPASAAARKTTADQPEPY